MCDSSIQPHVHRLRLPAGSIVFPPRCVRCGRPSTSERLIRKYRGFGLLQYAMVVFLHLDVLFAHDSQMRGFMALGPLFTVRVPVCQRCRANHAFLQFAGIFAIIVAMFYIAGTAIIPFICFPDDMAKLSLNLLVAVAALAFLYVTEPVMFSAIDGVLGVRFESYSREGQTVTLRFRDPSLAEEMMRHNPSAQPLGP